MSILRSTRSLIAAGLISALLASGCGGGKTMTPTMSAGWQQIDVGETFTFWVPPDAQEEKVQPIDSIIGIFNGLGYQIVYDYGRYGESPDSYGEYQSFESSERNVDGRRAQEVSFIDTEGSPEMPFVHILQVPDKGADTLTLRMACVDEETCEMADAVFGSVRHQ